MFTEHRAGVIPVDNISLPSGLNLGRLIVHLQRHQLHKTGDHFGGAWDPEFFEFASRLAQILVVVEIRPHFRMLRKEAHYRQALIIESLVHVTTTLAQHYLNLALCGLERKEAADQCANDYSQDAGYGR